MPDGEHNYRFPFREEVREKNRSLERRATKGSALAAIRLACCECCGSLREVASCPDDGCFLYPFRMGHKPKDSSSRTPKKTGRMPPQFKRKVEG